MKTLVVASNNKHKLREIAEIFTEFEVRSQTQMGFDEEVEETGGTFAEN
ncbi:MAG: non-canonical purine NTP pyrophosphatase, partial [Clostridia bacterium]|nr:non-canonical purine NTP pyrophosphatase [Clostridia bacterium]